MKYKRIGNRVDLAKNRVPEEYSAENPGNFREILSLYFGQDTDFRSLVFLVSGRDYRFSVNFSGVAKGQKGFMVKISLEGGLVYVRPRPPLNASAKLIEQGFTSQQRRLLNDIVPMVFTDISSTGFFI
jgi:hypothetical protein